MLGDRYVTNLRQKKMLKARADEAAKKLEVSGRGDAIETTCLRNCYVLLTLGDEISIVFKKLKLFFVYKF